MKREREDRRWKGSGREENKRGRRDRKKEIGRAGERGGGRGDATMRGRG